MSADEAPIAVVLQASGPNALGIIRSLAHEGVPVMATDRDPLAMGLRSRHARKMVLPDPVDDAAGFVEHLEVLGRSLAARGVLFPTHDEAIEVIGPHEERLSEWFDMPWSPWTHLQPYIDKAAQHAAARRIGFPVPLTVEPDDEADLRAAIPGMRFPVVLKPRVDPAGFKRTFGRQVLQAADGEALLAQWDRAAAHRPQVSEVIPGGDDTLWTLGSYRDADGRPLASFTGRKLRQWPPHFGTARAAEAWWDPGLAARGHALLDEMGFHGISQVEVKRDPRDGRDYLIEVNPRSWLWISLATEVGVNLPLAAYLDAIGESRTWPEGHRSDVRWVLSAKHLVATAGEVRRGRWGRRAAVDTLKPPVIDGVLSLSDPMPGIAQVGRILRRTTS
jgi:predicted ATP-grasp superfamily ATP-dependent carboligase